MIVIQTARLPRILLALAACVVIATAPRSVSEASPSPGGATAHSQSTLRQVALVISGKWEHFSRLLHRIVALVFCWSSASRVAQHGIDNFFRRGLRLIATGPPLLPQHWIIGLAFWGYTPAALWALVSPWESIYFAMLGCDIVMTVGHSCEAIRHMREGAAEEARRGADPREANLREMHIDLAFGGGAAPAGRVSSEAGVPSSKR